MAQVHNALQRTPGLVKSWGIRMGLDGGGLERAGETLTPVTDAFRPEDAYLRGEGRCSTWWTIGPGGAGTYAFASLWNWPAQNRMVILDRIHLAAGIASNVSLRWMGYTPAGLTLWPTAEMHFLDGRWYHGSFVSGARPQARVYYSDGLAVPGGYPFGFALAPFVSKRDRELSPAALARRVILPDDRVMPS